MREGTVECAGAADAFRRDASEQSGRNGVGVSEDEAHDIVQIRIALQDIEPPIWRRIQVPKDFPLRRLHDVIQAVIGWLDSHLQS